MVLAFRSGGGGGSSKAKTTMLSVNQVEREVRNENGVQFIWIGPTRKSPIEARAFHSALAKTMSPRCSATGGEVSESVSESESDDMMETYKVRTLSVAEERRGITVRTKVERRERGRLE